MRSNALGPQPEDMGSESPFLSHAQYGEVIPDGLLQDCLHRLSGLLDHQPTTPAGRFGKLPGEGVLYLVFHTGLDAVRAHDVQQRDLRGKPAAETGRQGQGGPPRLLLRRTGRRGGHAA